MIHTSTLPSHKSKYFCLGLHKFYPFTDTIFHKWKADKAKNANGGRLS